MSKKICRRNYLNEKFFEHYFERKRKKVKYEYILKQKVIEQDH